MQNAKEIETRKSHKDKTFEIIVNGRVKEVKDKILTFTQIVELAFDTVNDTNIIYTVTYKRGHGNKEGTLVKGDSVKIKDGMIFNVTPTNKS